MQNLDIHFIHAQRRRNLHGLIITRGAERASRDHSDAIFEIQYKSFRATPPLPQYSSDFSFLLSFLIFRDGAKLNRILAKKEKKEHCCHAVQH